MRLLVDRFFLQARTRLVLALVLCAAWLCAAPALANDTVLVVPNGPTRAAARLDVDRTDSPARVVSRGVQPLAVAGADPVPIRDLKLLPGGSALLADADGRGVVIVDAQGARTFSLDQPGARPRTMSASVSAFSAPGEVARILVTDNNRSQAYVVDPQRDATALWARNFALTRSQADFVQAIVLPGQTAAIAMNWRDMRIAGIDIFKMQAGIPQTLLRRIATEPHPNQPESLVVVPEVIELRDVMGLGNGNLLVTTRTRLFEMDLEGNIHWQIEIDQPQQDGGDSPIHGEFRAATVLPSGDIALATVQPGVWTAPHPNHRVYWMSASALAASQVEIIAQSEALDAAPARLRAAGDPSGSGTFGYNPGLDAEGSGSVDDLELVRPLTLSRPSFARGERLIASADIKNAGAQAVMLARLTVALSSSACGAQTAQSRLLIDMVALQIAPDEVLKPRGNIEIDQTFSPGHWCARLHAHPAGGDAVELGAPVAFEILESDAGTGSRIDVQDLGFWPGDDAGVPGTNRPPRQDDVEVEAGCACASNESSTPQLSWVSLLIVAGALHAVRRRRERCAHERR